MRTLVKLFAVTALFAFTAAGVTAQDWQEDPTYGSVRLSQGFMPDPHTTQLTAGGGTDVSIGDCSYGNVANAPDVDLYYEVNGAGTLYIYVDSNEDTTLLINTPSGQWICNDDGYTGLNPLISLPKAQSGLYNIWVGTYGSDYTSATLYISEINPQ